MASVSHFQLCPGVAHNVRSQHGHSWHLQSPSRALALSLSLSPSGSPKLKDHEKGRDDEPGGLQHAKLAVLRLLEAMHTPLRYAKKCQATPKTALRKHSHSQSPWLRSQVDLERAMEICMSPKPRSTRQMPGRRVGAVRLLVHHGEGIKGHLSLNRHFLPVRSCSGHRQGPLESSGSLVRNRMGWPSACCQSTVVDLSETCISLEHTPPSGLKQSELPTVRGTGKVTESRFAHCDLESESQPKQPKQADQARPFSLNMSGT